MATVTNEESIPNLAGVHDAFEQQDSRLEGNPDSVGVWWTISNFPSSHLLW